MSVVDASTPTVAARSTSGAGFTERLVTRLASWPLGRRRSATSRRGFLAGSALLGSALAVDPWGFVTKPQTAYASVCGTGAACSDGWTVFCCTITGANKCPPGSFVGGWWKADSSGFCAGAARYYIDCNATCGSGWQCRCNSSTCDQRRVACNQFRYGQCHTEISCYGPVVCRMVSCTPPWVLDRSCSSASATDNRTASHSAPCLPGPTTASITALYRQLGGTGGVLGYPVTEYLKYSQSVGYQRFLRGEIVAAPGIGTHAVYGISVSKWKQLGGYPGPLGAPTTTTARYADGSGWFTNFGNGIVVELQGYGVHGVWGSLFTTWKRLGGSGGVLGRPTSDTTKYSNGSGYFTNFSNGLVVARPGRSTVGVWGVAFDKWSQLRGTGGVLGAPTRDTTRYGDRIYSLFDRGEIVWTPALGAHGVWGPLWSAWNDRGGRAGRLGAPTTDVTVVSGGQQVVFEHGTLTYRTSDGSVIES